VLRLNPEARAPSAAPLEMSDAEKQPSFPEPALVTRPDEPEPEEPAPTRPDEEEEEGITPLEPATLPEEPDIDVPEPERLTAPS
jgi:hypothetical protein